MQNSRYVVVICRITIASSNLEPLELNSEKSTPEPTFSIKAILLNSVILTEEFAVDLDSCLCWGKPAVSYLCPVTDVFQFKKVH